MSAKPHTCNLKYQAKRAAFCVPPPLQGGAGWLLTGWFYLATRTLFLWSLILVRGVQKLLYFQTARPLYRNFVRTNPARNRNWLTPLQNALVRQVRWQVFRPDNKNRVCNYLHYVGVGISVLPIVYFSAYSKG